MATPADLQTCLDEAAASIGIRELKPEQREAIMAFAGGRDVFISLPTGYGKSICYGCLPALFTRLKRKVEDSTVQGCMAVVVTPLVSIMKDQTREFNKRGVSSVYISSSMKQQDEDNLLQGRFSLVYISPELLLCCRKWREMLMSDVFKEMMVAFVVDEAHCVKKWGDEFRQEFRHLGEVRSLIPQHVHTMALTATATKSLRKGVCTTLGMHDPFLVTVSPDKTNLVLQVQPFESLERTFLPLIEELKRKRVSMERTIVYCQQQEVCARLYLLFRLYLASEFTEPVGCPDLPQFRLVDMFTSGSHPAIKEIISVLFTTSSNLRILIATVAFGMGVNPPDVHRVYHCGPPNDIEMYVQEVGRGGRDGMHTVATLYYARSLKRFVDKNMIQYAEQSIICRRDMLFGDFDMYKHSSFNFGCKCCDICSLTCTCDDCNKNK